VSWLLRRPLLVGPNIHVESDLIDFMTNIITVL
jgi:hypothetical protein